MIDPELSSIEIVGVAVRAEREAFDLYLGLAAKVGNPTARAEFERLAGEEARHQEWLTAYYKEMTGGSDAPPMPDMRIKMFGPEPSEEMRIAEILDLAITKENLSETVYAEASKRSTDPSGRRMLGELVEFERSHARRLIAIREVLRRNPAWIEDPQGRAIQLEGP